MNKIRLYIEDQEIELQEEVQVSITRQFEEISNPTVICNDYTKTVKIPMTAHNNIIFGNIYNPDMISVAVPTNLFNDMVNGNEIIQSDNLFHTNKEYPIRYDHPEILFPVTLYNQYFPSNINLTTLTSYTVFRGIASLTPYETYVAATTELGRHTFTFTLDENMTDDQRVLTFKFNGTVSLGNLPWVEINLNNFEDGTYQCSFDTVLFDTTNKQFNLKNLVLTKGSEVVYGNDIANHIGIYFDPFRKLNFRLEWNGDLLMQGYAKMLSAKKENGKGFYEVTLNGELGKIFQEMKKITLDPTASGDSEGKYYIDGSQYVNQQITKELVYSGWTHNETILNIDNPNIKFYDIINFAPCNAFDDNFEYDSFQWNGNEQKKFSDVLTDINFKGSTGVDPDVAIPDGMTPRGIGEYRSYLQQPFIYFNKLFQIFQKKAETLTGYKFNLDESWFTTANTRWYKLVMMLKKLSEDDNKTYLNSYQDASCYSVFPPTNGTIIGNKWGYYFNGPQATKSIPTGWYVEMEQLPIYDDVQNKFVYDGGPALNNSTMNVNLTLTNTLNRNFDWDTEVRMAPDVGLVVYLTLTDGSNNQSTNAILFHDAETTIDTSQYLYHYVVPHATLRYSGDTVSVTANNIELGLTGGLAQSAFTFVVEADGVGASGYNYASLWQYKTSSNAWGAVTLGNIQVNAQINQLNIEVTPLSNRSYSYFTLNNLWNNDYNLFDVILNYCKMYRILIIADVYTKTLKFIPSYKYFENYTVKDWTDKVCTDKEFSVKPISWENKYVLFNYMDNETKLGKQYREEYGQDWGEKKIITEYNFNSDTDELFSGISPSLTYSPNVLSWTNLYENKRILYTLPNEVYVHMADDDGNYVKQFGAFYIMRGIHIFDTSEDLSMREAKISDDTVLQQKNNTYFYSQSENSKSVPSYPYLDIEDNNYNVCIFTAPMKNYTCWPMQYIGMSGIYENFWKKYINERYNRNNKIVTCYIHLTPYDYINFNFNDFIKIENQLYVVNKIYDYDAVTNQKVKVDLITVQDITGYTTR